MDANENVFKKWNRAGFDTLSILDFSFKDSTKNQAHIYANGENQVEVVVRVRMLDEKNNPIVLKPQEISDLIYFVNYTDGTEVKELDFTNEPSEYVKPILFRSQSKREVENEDFNKVEPKEPIAEELNTSIIFVTKYISSKVNFIEKQISVAINIPGVGDFDLSFDGTSTKNGPNNPNKIEPRNFFKSPKSLIIKTEAPIDYTEKDSLLIEYNPQNISDFTKRAEDVKVYTRRDGKIEYRRIGVSSFKEVRIKPKGNIKFKYKIKKTRNRQEYCIQQATMAGYTIERDEKNNKIIHKNKNGYCDTVWGYSEGDKGFHMSFIFADKYRSGIEYTSTAREFDYDRGIKLIDINNQEYTYTIQDDDDRHVFDSDLSNNYIHVIIADHFVPNLKIKENSFKNLPSNGSSYISITDEYGNRGDIKITMNDNSWPGISVNT